VAYSVKNASIRTYADARNIKLPRFPIPCGGLHSRKKLNPSGKVLANKYGRRRPKREVVLSER
jgi:hypothetical protein